MLVQSRWLGEDDGGLMEGVDWIVVDHVVLDCIVGRGVWM